MNIDRIKWMTGYADGFEWIDNKRGCQLKAPDGRYLTIKFIMNYRVYYPLLMQRAIEGINREEGYLIFQNFSEIRIEHNDNNGFERYYSFDDITPDQAKEAALKYIYEQIESDKVFRCLERCRKTFRY